MQQPANTVVSASGALQLERLAQRVLQQISASERERLEAWDDARFDALARALHDAQRTSVAAYGAWCALDPDAVEGATTWRKLPFLPIAAFKQLRVAAHEPRDDLRTFESSGTSGSGTSRHHLPALDPYERSLLSAAHVALVPDVDPASIRCIQLAPTATGVPRSSLSHMMDAIRTRLCTDGGSWATTSAVDADGALDALGGATAASERVLLLTTTFALVQLLDVMEARGTRIALPEGSRLMDTGGTKGKARAHSRAAMERRVVRRLGITPSMFENEYGMSELSSQWYLGTIARSVDLPLPGTSPRNPRGQRWGPPWLRSIVLDPATLEEVDVGDVGVLAHCDLANVWSCAFVRTEDAAIRTSTHGFRLVGRAPGTDSRGCSLPYEQAPA